jgi:LysR family glycine cleavage system transcriptional activator
MSNVFPPLNPLRVFEVAARTGSFTAAAEEMRVTQSAVSRQIATLEGYLGLRLFERGRGSVSLTATGESYRRQIAPAFELIGSATQQLVTQGRVEPLRIRVYTIFAAKWLIRRLPRFRAQYPKIKVHLDNAVAPVDFSKDRVDIAIPLGDGNWPGTEAELLFKDVIQPVCSPQLLKGDKSLKTIDDLSRFQLLHSRYRKKDWPHWLEAMGKSEVMKETMTFPTSVLTYQAAMEGIGVAIGQVNLLGEDFASGTLVPLFGPPIESGLGYYAVWPNDRPVSQKLRSFLSWLRKEAAAAAVKPA